MSDFILFKIATRELNRGDFRLSGLIIQREREELLFLDSLTSYIRFALLDFILQISVAILSVFLSRWIINLLFSILLEMLAMLVCMEDSLAKIISRVTFEPVLVLSCFSGLDGMLAEFASLPLPVLHKRPVASLRGVDSARSRLIVGDLSAGVGSAIVKHCSQESQTMIFVFCLTREPWKFASQRTRQGHEKLRSWSNRL